MHNGIASRDRSSIKHCNMSAPPEENPYVPTSSSPIPEDSNHPVEMEARREPLRDTRRLGRISIAFIIAQALCYSAAALLGWMQANGSGGAPSSLSLGFLSFSGLLFLIGGFFYFFWLHRTTANARLLNVLPLRAGAGIASYFIPVLCFFTPCRSMIEIVDVTYRDQPRAIPSSVVIGWWLSYLIGAISLQEAFDPPKDLGATLLCTGIWDASAVMISIIVFCVSKTQWKIRMEEAAS